MESKKQKDKSVRNAIGNHIHEVVKQNMRDNELMFKNKNNIVCYMD
jgi:hypothetical protein